jgi:hypothetical protein
MHQLLLWIWSTARRSMPRLLGARQTFTAAEVLQALQGDPAGDARTAAVHAVAERISLWLSLLPERLASDLGRASQRLPTVVYWYRQGVPPHEIGRRLSPFGDAWDGNRALDAAAGLIAEALNRGELAGVPHVIYR